MTAEKLRRIAFSVLFLPLLAPLFGCREKGPAGQAAPPEVEVVSVVQRDVPIYRDWVGTLDSEVNATISAQVSGYLISRAYREGSIVTNGQILFQIEPAPFEATLDQAKSDLARAQATETRWALTVQRYTP